jgi:hypothetical protein
MMALPSKLRAVNCRFVKKSNLGHQGDNLSRNDEYACQYAKILLLWHASVCIKRIENARRPKGSTRSANGPQTSLQNLPEKERHQACRD